MSRQVNRTVEEVILRQLPKAKVSAKEVVEIKKSIAEMRAGERVTLEELESAKLTEPKN